MKTVLSKNKHLIFMSLVIFIVSLSNFWIYWIFKNNFFLGEILIIESVLLFVSTISKSKIVSIVTISTLFILGFFLLINNFDRNIFSISTIESVQIKERQQFYAQEIGRLYKNRVGIFYFDHLRLIFSKISNNFFSALDLGQYFSQSQLIEQGKYPLVFFPLFIFGFILFMKKIRIIPVVYLITAICISTFTNLDSQLGLLLMIPLINFFIATGLIRLLEAIK